MTSFQSPRIRTDLHRKLATVDKEASSASDNFLRYLNGMALLHLMQISQRGEDELRELIETTTAKEH